VVGASMLAIKMKIPMEDKEVNATYLYHSWRKDTWSRVESSNEKIDGDKHSPIGKQAWKIDKGRTRWVPPLGGSIT
jgi:hypothetical protein